MAGQYYAVPSVAEFISFTGGTIKMAQVAVNGALNAKNFVAYAAYSRTTLARVALMHLNQWSTGNGTRPSTSVTLNGLTGASKIGVKYLNSPDGATGQASGVIYGGSQWTYASEGKRSLESETTPSRSRSAGEVQALGYPTHGKRMCS